YDGGKLISTRPFKAERISVGSAEADLVLDSASVDASHAVIDVTPQGVVLRATGASPLFLNGQPIIAAPLRHGDLISIGELRIMVELQKVAAQPHLAPVPPRRSPRLQLVAGKEVAEVKHAPALSVVRETAAAGALAETALLAEAEVELDLEPAEAAPVELPPAPAVRVADAHPYAVLPKVAVSGGECAEVEMFWGDTRVSVWQLLPGETFHAGSAAGNNALIQGIERANVLKSDANGWTIHAPRPLQLFLEEEGKVLRGQELLVRGRSQADAQGLSFALPQMGVAILASGNLALRVRRVRGVQRVGGETNDYRGVAAAAVAAVLMMTGMRYWSDSVPPAKIAAEPEVITPRPMVVRTTVKPPNDAPVPKTPQQNEGRKDPGQAVGRHMGIEGQAGSKTAPRREARAQRKTDDHALVANSGLLKALGGTGSSNSFGIALEKGAVDAMGHLTGPRVADAHGDGGMGLKSLGGRGGGGDGSGLGLARIGTNGIGGGTANYGDGQGGLRGKENGEIGLGPGKPEVVGSIDPELIRKVVHDHRAQLRTCYETQLTNKPKLAGKLVSGWTINEAGSVTEVHTAETTLHDNTVEECVASKIKSWRFPIPKGGGEASVTYPFVFTPGG
ncbi:MAG TPA: AgmX/PglI C-terminal domain-containing protein, partial [Myxococcales bacterium]|nr:AgmX/PglI C-terminal domain-containing protein [Myxococcales bacterium]